MASLILFIFLLFVWLPSGLYSGQVAHQKGYSGASWGFGGFFFGFIALIAAAGLPDKKLRKYFQQIKLRTEASSKDFLDNDSKDIDSISNKKIGPSFGRKDINFITSSGNKDIVYKKLVSEVTRCGFKRQFNELGIINYEMDTGPFGSLALLCKDEEDDFVLTIKGKWIKEEIQWNGTL